jgi:hypothetical protein
MLFMHALIWYSLYTGTQHAWIYVNSKERASIVICKKEVYRGPVPCKASEALNSDKVEYNVDL